MANKEDCMVVKYHNLLLDALRSRENEIIPFIAIIGPALGGYIWLLYKLNGKNPELIIITTIGIWILFLLGALYSAALGYNYRCILYQVKKIEQEQNIKKYIIKAWHEPVRDHSKKHASIFWNRIDWCPMPEVIKWFWVSFPVLILGVTAASWIQIKDYECKCILLFGIVPFVLGLIAPVYYGTKINQIYIDEKKNNP